MIKLKSLLFENKILVPRRSSEEREKTLVYHITKKSNVESIKKQGLIPNIPKEIPGEECGVYFFKSKEEAEDGFFNWYVDRYDEDEEFVLLTVDGSDLNLFSSPYEFEYICYDTVDPKFIIKIEDI
jgi:hypothetical protein